MRFIPQQIFNNFIMRISHKYKFIFLSKPKCASTSISKALNPYTDIFGSQSSRHYHHHVPVSILKQHFDGMGWDWNSYFKFTSVRNPWDMMVSLYNYGKPDIQGCYFWQRQDYDPNTRMSFDNWIRKGKSWDLVSMKHLNNFAAYSLPYYVLDQDNTFLVDYVMRVENLKEELSFVGSILGINLETFHLNRSKHNYYREYYDFNSRKLVESQFILDIDFGNYRF